MCCRQTVSRKFYIRITKSKPLQTLQTLWRFTCFYVSNLFRGYNPEKKLLLYNLLLQATITYPRYPSQSLRWRANRLPLWQHICFIIITEKYKPVKIQKAHSANTEMRFIFYFLLTINDTEGWLMLNKFAKNNCESPSSLYRRKISSLRPSRFLNGCTSITSLVMLIP